jgi:hypothetical protein
VPTRAGGFVANGARAGAGIDGDFNGGMGRLAWDEGDIIALVWRNDNHGRKNCCDAVGEVSLRDFMRR